MWRLQLSGSDATNRVATFTLAPGSSLLPLTSYNATVTGARSIATGLAMASPYSWTFTTGVVPDTARPMVTATAPVTSTPAATGVPINAAIVAAFTEDMIAATVTAAGTFRVTCAAPCTSPTGSVVYTAGSRAATFTPSAPLTAGTLYRRIRRGHRAQHAMAAMGHRAGCGDYVWTFTTVPRANDRTACVTPVYLHPGPEGIPANTLSRTFYDS